MTLYPFTVYCLDTKCQQHKTLASPPPSTFNRTVITTGAQMTAVTKSKTRPSEFHKTKNSTTSNIFCLFHFSAFSSSSSSNCRDIRPCSNASKSLLNARIRWRHKYSLASTSDATHGHLWQSRSLSCFRSRFRSERQILAVPRSRCPASQLCSGPGQISCRSAESSKWLSPLSGCECAPVHRANELPTCLPWRLGHTVRLCVTGALMRWHIFVHMCVMPLRLQTWMFINIHLYG